MNIILIVAIIAAFYNVEIVTFNKDYLSKQQTNNLKGIFIVVVLFHHLNIFAGVEECFNIFANAGYIAVSGFLFISGYGLMIQYEKRGWMYIKEFPRKRLLLIILPAIAIGLVYFVIKQIVYGYTVLDMLYDFRKGASVISNGWYITAILYFYIAFYVSSIIAELLKKMYVTLVFSGIMTILYICLCTKLKFEIHWFVPAFCFLYGLIWAYFQKLIDKNLEKSISLLIALIFVFYFGVVVWRNLEYGWLQFKSIMYLTVIIIVGTRVKLKSKVMEWLGSISYEIYLVHGLFFMLLRNDSINIANGFTFTVTVLVLSCFSAYFIHNYIVCRLKNKINVR